MITEKEINYSTDFVCTYQMISEYDEGFILYQLQLLQSFNLEIFDDEKINNITEQLYEKFKTNIYISKILESDFLTQNPLFDNDDLTKFRMYFGFDTFYLFHSLLCSLINNSKINEDNYKNLLNKK